MNLVALEIFADAVGPREEVHNVGVVLDASEFNCLDAGYFSAVENPLTQLSNTFPNQHLRRGLNQSHAHVSGNLAKIKRLAKQRERTADSRE